MIQMDSVRVPQDQVKRGALLLAVLLGWLVWGDVPNATAWAGIALIIAAGMALLRAAMGPTPARSARG